MKDDARLTAELEALQAEFAAYRTEAEAQIAALEATIRGQAAALGVTPEPDRTGVVFRGVDLEPLADDVQPKDTQPKPAKKPRRPRPVKGK